MWTIDEHIKAIKFKAAIDAANGEPGMPVPRDRLPSSYYREQRRREQLTPKPGEPTTPAYTEVEDLRTGEILFKEGKPVKDYKK